MRTDDKRKENTRKFTTEKTNTKTFKKTRKP